MILVVATVLLRLVPDGGMEAVLIVILTVEIIDMPSSHGKASYGILSER